MEVCVEPTLSIATPSEVVCLEFAPYEWCKSLLAVALPNVVNIYSIKFQEEVESGKAEFSLLCASQVEGECCAMAWSPQSALRAVPPSLKLMLATVGDAVIELSTDLKTTSVREVFRHTSCINSIAFSCINSESTLMTLCASVGDDQLLRVWEESTGQPSKERGIDGSVEEEELSGPVSGGWSESIMLMEPGQSVRFHPEDPSQLLVCEVSGTLRLYRITTSSADDSGPQSALTAEWSVRCPSPALDADWSLCDPDLLLAAGPAGVTIINMDGNGSVRKRVRAVGGGEGGSSAVVCVRGARSTHALAAAVTPDNTVTVVHTTASRIPLAAHLKCVSGISWHLELPYLAVGSDRRVLLWRVDHV